MNLRGCGTALVTPFRHDGAVDEAALRELVAWQVESGIDFLVPCGTTGETPTLSRKEWLRVVELTVEVAGGRVPIVAGATSNCTREAIEKARVLADRAGVDAILTASPYYNKPTQEGQFQHFRAIAQAVKKPLILYNVPGRTGANIEPATLARLAHIRNIIGVKEASGNLTQIVEVFNAVPASFLVFSGDDAVTLPVISLGGVGIISVVSNEIPQEMAEMTRAALNNDWETARRLHRKYLPLMQANFLESNPIPVKAALAMMGKIREVYRLPLVRMKEDTRAKLEKAMIGAGLEVKAAEPAPPRRPRPVPVTAGAVPDQPTAGPEMEPGVQAEVAAGSDGNAAETAPETAEMSMETAAATSAPVAEAVSEESTAALQIENATASVAVAEEAPATVPAAPALETAHEPLTFFLYESWQAGPHKLVLHRSTCGACRAGTGHPSGSDEAHSRWHGPYTTAQEARDTSRSLSNILIRSECKCMSKS
ncbi:MAG TPA: 4-hydroxy-tetrahydrodipicolinate synthase [Terriglobales bacterium]|nr:4-hydroxy-tetrahydrodipicolinate synthase [Terriglobales bacterium]